MMSTICVLHLIDSLATGGAERVAVNFVNALNEDESVMAWLCATRTEGPLKDSVASTSRYFFLQKKHTLDIKAIKRLILFINREGIQIIHAHSSSYFLAVLVKLFTKVKVIWHDHYGHSEFLAERPAFALKLFARFFAAVLSVNPKLEAWAKQELPIQTERIFFVPHFADLSFDDEEKQSNNSNVIQILCLANLRSQKDHLNLLAAIKLLKNEYDVSDFIVSIAGIDLNDEYSQQIKDFIFNNQLEQYVEILGAQSDISSILSNADIGTLSSKSEGLPVALLEYGLAGLPVVCTSVGECQEVLGYGEYGLLVPPKSPEQLAEALKKLLADATLRERLGEAFQAHVNKHYSKTAVVHQLKEIYLAI